MDPLSIATGVITLIGACNALASTIKKLHQLREAPKELEDLEKELSTLRSCTEGVNHLLQTQDNHRSGITPGFVFENAEGRENELHIQEFVLEARAMHELQLKTFESLREELQRPALAAELEMRLPTTSQNMQTVPRERISSSSVPVAGLGRSDDRSITNTTGSLSSGNVRRLQQLFIQGSASPLDASDTGWTLLHYALSAGQLPTAKFLKDSGADVRAESTSRETPINVAWNRILSGCLDVESEHLLRNVFDDDGQLDERQFTTLHKIVLGIIGKNLTEELGVTTSHINAIDSSGNTPLSWAAARGDSESVVVLLEHGANLSIANDVSISPIHLAAQTGNIATIRALVQAGADVNSVTLDSNAPIMLAVANNSHECIRRLIEAGADCSIVRDSQWNILHYAAIGGSVDTLRSLVKADLSNVDLRELRTKDTGQTVNDMLHARLEALSFVEEDSEKRAAWGSAWDCLMTPTADQSCGTELGQDLNSPLVRSNTDSIYVDADDQPFECRSELESQVG
ncbi:MAG: hypothetical protein Q9182_007419 [Xanthomendoza sp. 2 TL-2023]